MGPYALGQILPWLATARKRRSLPKIGASAGPAQEPQTGKMGGMDAGSELRVSRLKTTQRQRLPRPPSNWAMAHGREGGWFVWALLEWASVGTTVGCQLCRPARWQAM